MRSLFACACALALAGCPDAASGPDGSGGDDGGGAPDLARPPIVVPPPVRPSPKDWEGLPFPKAQDGRMVVLALPGMTMTLDPTLADGITALADCTAMIVDCYQPKVHSLDDCVAAAPACATATPWKEAKACCPTKCADAYQAARKGGQDPVTAFDKTYFAPGGGCFPGIPVQ